MSSQVTVAHLASYCALRNFCDLICLKLILLVWLETSEGAHPISDFIFDVSLQILEETG